VDPMKAWADAEEAKKRNQGGILGHLRGMNDVARSTVQGTAVGKWGDQINAYLASSGVPLFGGGEGRTYEQELALQQARNRATETEHPIGHTIAGLVGGTGAAWMTGGFGGPATQTILDTISASSNAASNAPDGSRGQAGVAGGAATLPMSAILNAISNSFNKYSRLTPEIAAAARHLGIDLPFFAKAEQPGVQAAGRQYAQTHLDSPLNKSWQAGSGLGGDCPGTQFESRRYHHHQAPMGRLLRHGARSPIAATWNQHHRPRRDRHQYGRRIDRPRRSRARLRASPGRGRNVVHERRGPPVFRPPDFAPAGIGPFDGGGARRLGEVAALPNPGYIYSGNGNNVDLGIFS